jgi:ribonuclease G
MTNKLFQIFINHTFIETRIAICTRKHVEEIWIDRVNQDKSDFIVGNIYLGSVDRVLPGMQAAFIDIGLEKNGFLYGGDLASEDTDQADYYDDEDIPEPKIPTFNALKSGQPVLVQVTKGPISTKGPRLTTNINIPGKFIVLIPQSSKIGISKKISHPEERDKLYKAIKQVRKTENVTFGLIIRTAASHISTHKLQQEYVKLSLLWKEILQKQENVTAPALLHSDNDILDRIMREYCSNPKTRIITDSPEIYANLVQLAQNRYFFPIKNIAMYEKRSALFEDFGIEHELQKAIDRKVWLKSGGYLIFDETEALTVVDVNTGRYVGKKNLEETLLQINLEAAEEMVHQVILRNISGIIIVDFIDMDEETNRHRVFDTLKRLLREDRVRNSVLAMTQLGLIQITRKRTHPSLLHQLSDLCPHCNGKGRIKSTETVLMDIFRQIKFKSIHHRRKKRFQVLVGDTIYQAVHGEHKELLKQVEQGLKVKIGFRTQPNFHKEEFDVS